LCVSYPINVLLPGPRTGLGHVLDEDGYKQDRGGGAVLGVVHDRLVAERVELHRGRDQQHEGGDAHLQEGQRGRVRHQPQRPCQVGWSGRAIRVSGCAPG
jgi:hypothetical protein